jgi:hypothetical protein
MCGAAGEYTLLTAGRTADVSRAQQCQACEPASHTITTISTIQLFMISGVGHSYARRTL